MGERVSENRYLCSDRKEIDTEKIEMGVERIYS